MEKEFSWCATDVAAQVTLPLSVMLEAELMDHHFLVPEEEEGEVVEVKDGVLEDAPHLFFAKGVVGTATLLANATLHLEWMACRSEGRGLLCPQGVVSGVEEGLHQLHPPLSVQFVAARAIHPQHVMPAQEWMAHG